MKLEDTASGFSVEVKYDYDGFPYVIIDTASGYLDENNRPTVNVQINGKTIHKMFDEDE